MPLVCFDPCNWRWQENVSSVLYWRNWKWKSIYVQTGKIIKTFESPGYVMPVWVTLFLWGSLIFDISKQHNKNNWSHPGLLWVTNPVTVRGTHGSSDTGVAPLGWFALFVWVMLKSSNPDVPSPVRRIWMPLRVPFNTTLSTQIAVTSLNLLGFDGSWQLPVRSPCFWMRRWPHMPAAVVQWAGELSLQIQADDKTYMDSGSSTTYNLLIKVFLN